MISFEIGFYKPLSSFWPIIINININVNTQAADAMHDVINLSTPMLQAY